jgi:hypothetical protein
MGFGTVSIALHYRHHVARRPAMLYELLQLLPKGLVNPYGPSPHLHTS